MFRAGPEEPGDVGVDDGLPLSQADATSARTSTHFPDFTTAALFERRNTLIQVAVRITFITRSSLDGGPVSAVWLSRVPKEGCKPNASSVPFRMAPKPCVRWRIPITRFSRYRRPLGEITLLSVVFQKQKPWLPSRQATQKTR